MKEIILKEGKERSVYRRHPWIFSGAVKHLDKGIKEGDIVRVVDAERKFLAVGHYQIGSIAIRILSFEDIEITHDFWVERFHHALEVRQVEGLAQQFSDPNSDTAPPSTPPARANNPPRAPTAPNTAKGGKNLENTPTSDSANITKQADPKNTTIEHHISSSSPENLQYNNVFRLIHGEGDFLPGLVIDIYGDVAVVQFHSVGMYYAKEEITKTLIELLGSSLRAIYDKSEGTLPFKAGLNAQNGYLYGEAENFIATENGLKFYVDWLEGQKTGFFIDQRANRALLERYAKGRDVLNMFCYTGGFSFYAMRGGAKTVTSVDISERAVELAARNVELNFPDDPRHTTCVADAFEFLNQSEGKYDLIILDPPAFAKHLNVVNNAIQGYKKLNKKALEVIRPGGILFTFSCSQVITPETFRQTIFTAAANTRRNIRILHRLSQAADHPVSIYHPEGEYLKGLVLYVE